MQNPKDASPGHDYCGHDLSYLFTLRIKLRKDLPLIIIHAWDGNAPTMNSHNRIDCELRMGGKIIFPRGETYCGLPRHTCIDGIAARELVLSLFAMKPGDTDDEYFKAYTEEQLDFAKTYGEDLDIVKQERYCDPETGECK